MLTRAGGVHLGIAGITLGLGTPKGPGELIDVGLVFSFFSTLAGGSFTSIFAGGSDFSIFETDFCSVAFGSTFDAF